MNSYLMDNFNFLFVPAFKKTSAQNREIKNMQMNKDFIIITCHEQYNFKMKQTKNTFTDLLSCSQITIII